MALFSDTDLYAGGGSQLIVDSFNMMKTIVIAVCSAIAYLAIVIGLTVYCSIRLVRSKNQRKQHGDVPNGNGKVENGVVNEHTELMEKKDRDSSILKPFSDDARSHLSGGSSQPSSHSQSSRSKSSVDKLSFPRHQLQTLRMLGTCTKYKKTCH
jgi:PTK7 protein tyrosine kinase 7